MAVIEHWPGDVTLYMCPNGCGYGLKREPCENCRDPLVVVDVVPEAQLQGAVQEAERLRTEIDVLRRMLHLEGVQVPEINETVAAEIAHAGRRYTDAQLDGLACMDCGRRDGAMVPAGEGPRGQLFRHAGESCS